MPPLLGLIQWQNLLRNTIQSWGITASNINLVGHSLGAYVAYEVSERLGGINNLVALNPASTTLGGYDQSQVNFSRYSNWSWAFFNNNRTDNSDISQTADESFQFALDPVSTVWDGHGGAKILWTNMLKDKNGISSYFGLEDMNGSNKPWYIGPGWEAKILAKDNWIPTGLYDA
jgi:pimeloyl-ACP methyl ester carboxylesterase